MTVLSFGLDVLAALQYVHGRNILAVDLRPDTLYINEYGIIKLADFGCACNVERPHGYDAAGPPEAGGAQERLVTMARSTPSYVAPELLSNTRSHSRASDFWAFGALLHEMAAGAPPYAMDDRPVEEVAHAVLYAPYANPQQCSEQLNELLKRMLTKDAEMRLDWPELVDHSFWRGVAPRPQQQQQQQQQQPPQQQQRSGAGQQSSSAAASSSRGWPPLSRRAPSRRRQGRRRRHARRWRRHKRLWQRRRLITRRRAKGAQPPPTTPPQQQRRRRRDRPRGRAATGVILRTRRRIPPSRQEEENARVTTVCSSVSLSGVGGRPVQGGYAAAAACYR